MTTNEFLQQYTGKFIEIWDSEQGDIFFLFIKNRNSAIIYRPIGVIQFDFDIRSWAVFFSKDRYKYTEMKKEDWVAYAIRIIFNNV